jgi:hypothetical protein
MRYHTPDIDRPFESLVTVPAIVPAIAASVVITAKTVIMITFFTAQQPHFFKKNNISILFRISHLYQLKLENAIGVITTLPPVIPQGTLTGGMVDAISKAHIFTQLVSVRF